MANKGKVKTVAKVYLIVCYGLAAATLFTFGGAEGGPQLPTLAYWLMTLPSSLILILLTTGKEGDWILFVFLLLMPVVNLSLGWLVWWVIRRLVGDRTNPGS